MSRPAASPIARPAAVLAAVLLFGATACSRQEAPPPPAAVKKPVPKEAPGAPIPAVDNAARAEAPRGYNPAGKRDPFEPFLKAAAKGEGPDLSALPPLLRYDLGELRYVGLIWGVKGPRALVEDAEGKGYTVKVGTRIGRLGGTVLRISEQEITVGEETRDSQGTRLVREVAMKMKTPGGRK